MAATTAAVVAEEDTELRDLLVQTLENSGVLNRIKVRRGGCRGSRLHGARDAGTGAATRPWGLGPSSWARCGAHRPVAFPSSLHARPAPSSLVPFFQVAKMTSNLVGFSFEG